MIHPDTTLALLMKINGADFFVSENKRFARGP
jgi:hypothetical protein